MNYAGFYINLDRSVDRKAHMDAQLTRLELQNCYSRFPAAEGNALGFPNPNNLRTGEMGCFTSHYMILKENLAQPRNLHIVEDDVLFSRWSGQAVSNAIANGVMSHFDILYTSIFLPVRSDAFRDYKRVYDLMVKQDERGNIAAVTLEVIDLKDSYFAGTSSLLISAGAIPKIYGIYEEELTKGPQKPLDLFLRKCIWDQRIKAGCLFPFVTSILLDSPTTIIDRKPDQDKRWRSVMAASIAQQSFFVECNWDQCRELTAKFLTAQKDDRHRQLLADVLSFSITSQWDDQI